MVRVLQMVGSLDIGGSQIMVMNLYRAMDRERVQFDFIVDRPDKMFFAEEIKALGGKVYVMPQFKGTNISKIKKAWKKFFLEHPEYKVLHSHVRSYASIYLPIAKKCGVKTIIHSHSTSEGKGLKNFVKRVLERPLRRQADYLMACSADAGVWLYGKRAVQKENYFFIPNAIDIEKYSYNESVRAQYRKDLGVEGKYVIGHVGRLHPSKNHLFLLDVFKEVKAKRQEAMLLIVGDGDLREKVEEKIEQLGLQESIIMAGARKDVAQLMQAMDTFVFPSVWEGLPVTVVEAQTSGLPCFISDTITEECIFSKRAKRLSISDKRAWVEAIADIKGEMNAPLENLAGNTFDIRRSAEFFVNFYNNLVISEK